VTFEQEEMLCQVRATCKSLQKQLQKQWVQRDELQGLVGSLKHELYKQDEEIERLKCKCDRYRNYLHLIASERTTDKAHLANESLSMEADERGDDHTEGPGDAGGPTEAPYRP
jgi:hypothetical protein